MLIETKVTTLHQVAIDKIYKQMYADDITKSSYSYLDEYYKKYNIIARTKERRKENNKTHRLNLKRKGII